MPGMQALISHLMRREFPKHDFMAVERSPSYASDGVEKISVFSGCRLSGDAASPLNMDKHGVQR